MLASRAAIRSGTFCGSSEGCSITMSSPCALRSIISSTRSRYSSRYLSGSKSEESDSISCVAMSSSRLLVFFFDSPAPLSSLSGGITSSAKSIVSMASTSVARADGHQVLLRAEHDAGDRRPCRRSIASTAACRPSRRRCRARGSRGGRRRSGRSRRGPRSPRCRSCASSPANRVELLRRDDHVAVGADLVALDEVLVRHLLARGRAHALLLDALARLSVDLVEAHRLPRDRAEQLDRDVHQAEADRSTPNRSRHRLKVTRPRAFNPLHGCNLAGPCPAAGP